MEQDLRVGIGFATGRKSFMKVLKTNIYNWRECGLTEKERYKLNLFVAYDLKYSGTKATDYTNVKPSLLELIDDTCFIGSGLMKHETEKLVKHEVLTPREAALFFAGGYAAKRNAILYMALKHKMDYLIFLDDDEYPMAVTETRSTVLWGGQHVLATHLSHIGNADITNGYHCGYISPIPYISFDERLREEEFRLFIEAISNDIINWDKIKSTMQNGGVTYADKSILVSEQAAEAKEQQGTKFISGSNLCINLTKPERTHPFYNPPKARGEDTFLSTCLHSNTVLRVPCYTFHDAFSIYKPLMDGVLPITLKHITTESEQVVTRFYRACIGWVRYKPLLLYITQREAYDALIKNMREKLTSTLPKICAYFGRDDFMKILDELTYYDKKVKAHYADFVLTQTIWEKLQRHVAAGE